MSQIRSRFYPTGSVSLEQAAPNDFDTFSQEVNHVFDSGKEIGKGMIVSARARMGKFLSGVKDVVQRASDFMDKKVQPVVMAKVENLSKAAKVHVSVIGGLGYHVAKTGVDLFKSEVLPSVGQDIGGIGALSLEIVKKDVLLFIATARERIGLFVSTVIEKAPIAVGAVENGMAYVNGQTHALAHTVVANVESGRQFVQDRFLPALEKAVNFTDDKISRGLKVVDRKSDAVLSRAETFIEKSVLPRIDQGVDSFLMKTKGGVKWFNNHSNIWMTGVERFLMNKVAPAVQKGIRVVASKARNARFNGFVNGIEYKKNQPLSSPESVQGELGKLNSRKQKKLSPLEIMKRVEYFSFPVRTRNSQGLFQNILVYKPDFGKVEVSHYDARHFIYDCEYALRAFIESPQFKKYKAADFRSLGGESFRPEDRMIPSGAIEALREDLYAYLTKRTILREADINLLQVLNLLSVEDGLRFKRQLQLPLDHMNQYGVSLDVAA